MNTQEDFLKLANKGKNIFLTGIRGSGKTYILNKWSEEQELKGKKIIKVRPTGIAAINCGGATIHSTFKLYGDNYHVINRQIVNWREIDILIIDEISMVSCEMFDYISNVIKKSVSSNKPFGGLQVICVGDLNQLPPIYNLNVERTKKRYDKLIKEKGGITFNLSEAYKQGKFVKINLTNSQRSKDNKLNNLLNRIRSGDLKALDEFKSTGYTSHFYNKATHIFPYNNLVDLYNNNKLAKLPGKQFIFEGIINGEFDMSSVLVPKKLKLKIGARIMIVKNLGNGLVNGDIGEIIEINPKELRIKIFSDRFQKEYYIGLEEWENKVYDENGKSKIIGTLKHFPIKLGWRMTRHKTQGLTLDKVIFHYNKYLSKELIYVRLSRGKEYNNIYVIK